MKNSTFAKRVQASPTWQSSKKAQKGPLQTLEYYLRWKIVQEIMNPAVTKDESTKNPITPEPLTSASRVIGQNFRWSATYPTVVESNPSSIHPG